MKSQILRTKLYIPSPSSQLVSRPRLMSQMNEVMRHKFTLISAPPGFGKTTLVSSWIKQLDNGQGQKDRKAGVSHSKIAWVTLDKSDNEPTQFWHYVIAALQTIDAALGETVLAILDSPQAPPLDVLVTTVINDVLDFHLDIGKYNPIILVLEDYHLITSEGIHDSLNFLIDHLPPLLHLVITTRSDPPLRLSHRQGRYEINHIRAKDLSFTNYEVATFLNSLMELELSEADITALETRTEGWIAGLQLAALSLRAQEDKHSFVIDFAGNDRYIADYLLDEVLLLQPEQIQTFLLQTSILDKFSAGLCDAITDQNDSKTILAQIERANLFLNPLDNQREWYRYHQLFKDLLYQRLCDSSTSAEIARLHKKAYKWLEDNRDVIEAVNHALLAENYPIVAELIELYAAEIFEEFKLNTLSKWINALPAKVMADRLKLSMINAWALLATGHLDEAEKSLQFIEKITKAHTEKITAAEMKELDPELRGVLIEVIVVRSVIAITKFNIPRTHELCQLVLPYLKDNSQSYFFNPPLSLRTVVVFNLGLAHEFSGNGSEAAETFSEAVSLSIEHENNNILPIATAHLGQLQILQGHLFKAEKTYQQALKLASKTKGRVSPLAGTAEIGLGNLFYERNDLGRAHNHYLSGIALAERWNHAESLLAANTGLAQLKQAQGDESGATALIHDLTDMLQKYDAQMLLPAVDAFRARLWIAQGNLAEAGHWLETSKLTVEGNLSYFQENDYITMARVLIAQKRLDEVEGLISRLLDFAEAGHRGGRVDRLAD